MYVWCPGVEATLIILFVRSSCRVCAQLLVIPNSEGEGRDQVCIVFCPPRRFQILFTGGGVRVGASLVKLARRGVGPTSHCTVAQNTAH